MPVPKFVPNRAVSANLEIVYFDEQGDRTRTTGPGRIRGRRGEKFFQVVVTVDFSAEYRDLDFILPRADTLWPLED